MSGTERDCAEAASEEEQFRAFESTGPDGLEDDPAVPAAMRSLNAAFRLRLALG